MRTKSFGRNTALRKLNSNLSVEIMIITVLIKCFVYGISNPDILFRLPEHTICDLYIYYD